MANSPDFVAHVVELMREAGRVTSRAMFGGHGVYVDGVIVAIVVADVLYLKTDDETRPRFVAEGLAPFEYATRRGTREVTSYFAPPGEALESPAAMRDWLRLAIGAALRNQARKKSIAPPASTKRAR